MISNIGNLVAGLVIGAAFGGVYLALLWVAVRRLPASGGGLLFMLLALSRAALVILALWLAISLDLAVPAMLGAVAGFVAIRVIATRAADLQTGHATWK
ncbi:N-ATPase subunit AtpR [Yoonia sp.]|uniref:N-ATPase subunit AtpR n=1 Tax=Yoonia sp. TaxID=2212373 RepID=UPI003F6B678D